MCERKPLAYRCRLVAPPPNITGELHVGHVLNLMLQQIIIAEWGAQNAHVQRIIGLDHAGLAVKHVLALRYGRASVSTFWAWKRRIGRRALLEIARVLAMRLLPRVRFTLDRAFSIAVACAFVKLYKAKLAVNKLRLLWWDRALEASISKLETRFCVEWRHVLMWRFAFRSGEAIVWDCKRLAWFKTNFALAARAASNVSMRALIVNLNELSLLRLDSSWIIDAANGNKLKLIVNVGAADANRSASVSTAVSIRVVLALLSMSSSYLSALTAVNAFICVNLLVCANIAYSLRTGALAQRKLTAQWFVNLRELLAYCNMARIRVWPRRWKRALSVWTEDLGLWCVSRAMDWGHNLPIWKAGNALAVCDTRFKALYYLILGSAAALHLSRINKLTKALKAESLVFDTWFSSSLWCVCCLGWPNKTRQLRLSVDTSAVLTGFDIIFFWILKMLLMSCFLVRGWLPFTHIIVHPVVCDALGQKMSKTKNNAISPRALFNAFGAESVRFYFSGVNLNAQQFKMCLNTLIACRNASTKLWNIQRVSVRCANGTMCARSLYACKWAITSAFIRIKHTTLALRTFNTSAYLQELLNLIKFDLSNHINAVTAQCACAQTLYNIVCWRYRAVVSNSVKALSLDTCYVSAFAITLLTIRLMVLVAKANIVCTNCRRVCCQASAPVAQCVRAPIIYFNKLRLSSDWQLALWHNGLFAWR
ncbi:MAG: class I tRNA ligase family protein [Candidatus Hodgkinia cicadicola]